jgi:hypothetical protein
LDRLLIPLLKNNPKTLLDGFQSRWKPTFFVAALEEALGMYGCPEIFNTDQGGQFTSMDFTQTLKEAGISISMDGKGRWMDNVMVERLCGL